MDKRAVKKKNKKKNKKEKVMGKRVDDSLESIAKKQSLPSLRRIGIIRHNYLGEHDDFCIHVVNVDLSSSDDFEDPYKCEKPTAIDEFTRSRQRLMGSPMAPAVHLRLVPRFTMSRLCVVNSTVYVFDGYTETTFHESDPKFNAKWISRYVLTEEILGGVNIEEVGESDLTKACEMKYPKYRPRAVPTPNGKKILIFSGFIAPLLKGCFELYDIDSNTCKLLPPMQPFYSIYEAHFPAAYSFLSDTIFFLETDIGRYIFDLESCDWEPLGFPSIPWEMHIKGYSQGFRKGFRKGFEVLEGEYALNLDSVHYLPGLFLKRQRGVEENREEGKRSIFPLSSKPVGQLLLDKDMMLVDYNLEDKVSHVCTLRAYPLDGKTRDKAQVFIDRVH